MSSLISESTSVAAAVAAAVAKAAADAALRAGPAETLSMVSMETGEGKSKSPVPDTKVAEAAVNKEANGDDDDDDDDEESDSSDSSSSSSDEDEAIGFAEIGARARKRQAELAKKIGDGAHKPDPLTEDEFENSPFRAKQAADPRTILRDVYEARVENVRDVNHPTTPFLSDFKQFLSSACEESAAIHRVKCGRYNDLVKDPVRRAQWKDYPETIDPLSASAFEQLLWREEVNEKGILQKFCGITDHVHFSNDECPLCANDRHYCEFRDREANGLNEDSREDAFAALVQEREQAREKVDKCPRAQVFAELKRQKQLAEKKAKAEAKAKAKAEHLAAAAAKKLVDQEAERKRVEALLWNPSDEDILFDSKFPRVVICEKHGKITCSAMLDFDTLECKTCKNAGLPECFVRIESVNGPRVYNCAESDKRRLLMFSVNGSMTAAKERLFAHRNKLALELKKLQEKKFAVQVAWSDASVKTRGELAELYRKENEVKKSIQERHDVALRALERCKFAESDWVECEENFEQRMLALKEVHENRLCKILERITASESAYSKACAQSAEIQDKFLSKLMEAQEKEWELEAEKSRLSSRITALQATIAERSASSSSYSSPSASGSGSRASAGLSVSPSPVAVVASASASVSPVSETVNDVKAATQMVMLEPAESRDNESVGSKRKSPSSMSTSPASSVVSDSSTTVALPSPAKKARTDSGASSPAVSTSPITKSVALIDLTDGSGDL